MKRQEKSGFREWFAWGWISFFLFLSLFKNGIFIGIGLHSPSQYQFESAVLLTLIITTVVALWVIIQAGKKNFIWTTDHTRNVILSAFIPCIYIVSSLQAVSPYMAQYSVWIHLSIFIFFVSGIIWSQSNKLVISFPHIFLGFGYLVVIFGFLTMFGNAYLLDSLAFYDVVRISSIFQYPNAYAVLLLILWIMIIIEVNNTTKRASRLLHSIMLVPVCVSFFLTLSRGALIILPLIIIVTLLMLSLKMQFKLLLYSILGAVGSLLIYSKLASRGLKVATQIQNDSAAGLKYDSVSIFSKSSIEYWAILILVSLVVGVVIYLLEKYTNKKLQKTIERFNYPMSNLWVPIILVILAIVGAAATRIKAITQILPETLRNRVEGINLETHSVYERLIMYKDASKIWREFPIFGGGGGAWEALYEKYQSYPYQSAQTHSFVTQLLVEVGLVGTVGILAFIGCILISFAIKFKKMDERNKKKYIFYFIVPITILLHSLIDFEMSYLLYVILVFMCMGVLAGASSGSAALTENRNKIFKRTSTIVIGFISLSMLTLASMKLYSTNQISESLSALDRQEPFNEIVNSLKSGLKSTRNNPVILQQLTNLYYQAYEQSKDESYLKESEVYMKKLTSAEPYYRTSFNLQYAVKLAKGDREAAIEGLKRAIEQYPFEQTFYDQIETNLFAQWDIERLAKNTSKVLSIGKEISYYYELAIRQEAIIKDLPTYVILNRQFIVSSPIRLARGRVSYYSGEFQQAIDSLRPALSDDFSNEENRDVARYYLASLKNLGNDDLALYNKLMSVDSSEKQKLDALLSENSN